MESGPRIPHHLTKVVMVQAGEQKLARLKNFLRKLRLDYRLPGRSIPGKSRLLEGMRPKSGRLRDLKHTISPKSTPPAVSSPRNPTNRRPVETSSGEHQSLPHPRTGSGSMCHLYRPLERGSSRHNCTQRDSVLDARLPTIALLARQASD